MSIEVGSALIAKIIGSAAGAILALVFVPPKTMRGFLRRGAAALISGPIFAPYVQSWAGFTADIDGMISAACLAAFASWWLMGALKRAVDLWKPPNVDQED